MGHTATAGAPPPSLIGLLVIYNWVIFQTSSSMRRNIMIRSMNCAFSNLYHLQECWDFRSQDLWLPEAKVPYMGAKMRRNIRSW